MNNVAIKINGEIIDIDDNSAIGFNFQSYNPANPENLFLSYTNTFSVPLTKKNKRIFSFSDSVNYNGREIYDKYSVSVYIGGVLLFSGRLFVVSVGERIELNVIDKLDFIEALKNIPFSVASDEGVCIQRWIVDEVNENNNFSTFGELVQYLATGTNTLWLPYSLGTTHEVFTERNNTGAIRSTPETRTLGVGTEISPKDNNIDYKRDFANNFDNSYYTDRIKGKIYDFDNEKNISLFQTMAHGRGTAITETFGIKTGHIFCKVSTIIEKILNYLNVESNLSSFVSNQYVRLGDIIPFPISENTLPRWLFVYSWKHSIYSLEAISNEYMNLTAWDLIKMLIQEYNLVVDVSYNVETLKYVYTFSQFNDIADKVPTNYKLNSIETKSFEIENVKQKCVIAYDSLGNSEDKDTSAGLLIECKNKNIEEGGDDEVLFSIGRFIPAYYALTDGNELENTMQIDVSQIDSINKLIMITPDTTAYANVNVWFDVRSWGENWTKRKEGNLLQTRAEFFGYDNKYYNPVVYDVPLLVARQSTVKVNGAYDVFSKMCEYPLVYKCKVVANVYKAIQHKALNVCRVYGLAGLYYISQIENYNPATDDYFNVTLYRLQRQQIDGEEQELYLATEYGTFVNTEENEYITIE